MPGTVLGRTPPFRAPHHTISLAGLIGGGPGPRPGEVSLAHRGVLFLDELGELDKAMQVKLLRFLESGEVRRVGENEAFHVDVRIVCATNRPLTDMIEEGTFREDLFYRLNVVSIHLPPLRERREDIPALAHHFLRKYAEANGKQIGGFAREVMAILEALKQSGALRADLIVI